VWTRLVPVQTLVRTSPDSCRETADEPPLTPSATNRHRLQPLPNASPATILIPFGLPGLSAWLRRRMRRCSIVAKGSHVSDFMRPDGNNRLWDSGCTRSGAACRHDRHHISIFHVQ